MAADPITIKNTGDRVRRLADHAVLMAVLDADGAPVPMEEQTPATPTVGSAGAPSSSLVQAVQGFGYRSEVAITRPSNTTAYTANDVIGVANSGTPANAGSAILEFANIGPSGGHIFVTDAILMIYLAAVPASMSTFRLYLYDSAPTAILDNTAFDVPSGDRTKLLGYIDMGAPVDLGSTLFVQNVGINRKLKLATGSTSLFGELVTAGGYTPTSGEVIVPRLHSVAV